MSLLTTATHPWLIFSFQGCFLLGLALFAAGFYFGWHSGRNALRVKVSGASDMLRHLHVIQNSGIDSKI